MSNFVKRFLQGVLIGVLIGFIAFVSYLFLFKESFLNTTNVTISLKWLHQGQFAGMYVAQEEGIYHKNGVNVSFHEFDFETNQIEQLVNNEAEFALISAEELLLARDKGIDIKAVAAFYQTSPYAVVSLADSKITGPSYFKGKILGNKGGKVEEELFYLSLLESVGLSGNDAEIRHIGFGKREIDDLLDGDVDTVGLYRTDQLYFFDQEQVDYNLIRPEQYGVNTYNDVLVAKTSFINENPDIVEAVVNGSVQGWQKAFDDYNLAIDHTLKYVTNNSYKDRDYEEFILKESEQLIYPDHRVPIGTMNFIQWNKLYLDLKEKEFIDNQFDPMDIFTLEFLDR